MLGKLFVSVVHALPLTVSLFISNLLARMRCTGVRFRVTEEGLLVAHSSENRVHFSGTPKRGLEYLTNGLDRRAQNLREEYLLDQITLEPKVVVDVGANSGDFLLALSTELKIYIGLEPIQEEFEALTRNCQLRDLVSPNHMAASNIDGTAQIFVSLSKGDSSIIKPGPGVFETREIASVKLDTLFSEGPLSLHSEIDLLKVEAEGFEPAILSGSQSLLQICKWVVVDGGPERGQEHETTIERCSNLFAQGFEMVALNIRSRPGVALFRNLRLAESSQGFEGKN